MKSLSREQVRDVDRRAIVEFGMPGVVLMENAGRNAAALVDALWPESAGARVCIVCGKGNNAGDGFVIARHLELSGHDVQIVLAAPAAELSGDAAVNHAIAAKAEIPIQDLSDGGATDWSRAIADSESLHDAGSDATQDGGSRPSDTPGRDRVTVDLVIIDALLGTGAQGEPRGAIATAIEAINTVRASSDRIRVLAVDLPSGLDCDSGGSAGACMRADATVTFVARKQGFDNPASRAFTGTVHTVGIGVPRRLLADLSGTE